MVPARDSFERRFIRLPGLNWFRKIFGERGGAGGADRAGIAARCARRTNLAAQLHQGLVENAHLLGGPLEAGREEQGRHRVPFLERRQSLQQAYVAMPEMSAVKGNISVGMNIHDRAGELDCQVS